MQKPIILVGLPTHYNIHPRQKMSIIKNEGEIAFFLGRRKTNFRWENLRILEYCGNENQYSA